MDAVHKNPLVRESATIQVDFSDKQINTLAREIAHHVSPPTERLLTREDVANRFSISLRSVDALIAGGKLVPIRVTLGGRGQRFEPAVVDAYIRRCARRKN